jgi:hypothetical protein
LKSCPFPDVILYESSEKKTGFFDTQKNIKSQKKSTVPSGTAQRMNSAFSVCGGSFAKIHLKSPVEVREIIKPGF